jgi:hypothetical protein
MGTPKIMSDEMKEKKAIEALRQRNPSMARKCLKPSMLAKSVSQLQIDHHFGSDDYAEDYVPFVVSEEDRLNAPIQSVARKNICDSMKQIKSGNGSSPGGFNIDIIKLVWNLDIASYGNKHTPH